MVCHHILPWVVHIPRPRLNWKRCASRPPSRLRSLSSHHLFRLGLRRPGSRPDTSSRPPHSSYSTAASRCMVSEIWAPRSPSHLFPGLAGLFSLADCDSTRCVSRDSWCWRRLVDDGCASHCLRRGVSPAEGKIPRHIRSGRHSRERCRSADWRCTGDFIHRGVGDGSSGSTCRSQSFVRLLSCSQCHSRRRLEAGRRKSPRSNFSAVSSPFADPYCLFLASLGLERTMPGTRPRSYCPLYWAFAPLPHPWRGSNT